MSHPRRHRAHLFRLSDISEEEENRLHRLGPAVRKDQRERQDDTSESVPAVRKDQRERQDDTSESVPAERRDGVLIFPEAEPDQLLPNGGFLKTFIFDETGRSGPSGYPPTALRIFAVFNRSHDVLYIRLAASYEEFTLDFYDIEFHKRRCAISGAEVWDIKPETISEGVGWLPCGCMGRNWPEFYTKVIREWLGTSFMTRRG